jgi:hypothetical protein
MLILILSFGMISSSFATSKVYDQNDLEIEKVEENVIDDTTTKFTTIFNNGIEEILYVRKISSEKTEIYDSKNQLIATISEKIENLELNLEPNLKTIDTNGKSGSYYSNTSPYPISDYNFQESVDGDIKLKKKLGGYTLTALSGLIGLISPGLGFFFAMAVLNNTHYDDFLMSTHLYYTRSTGYHKYLGSLEKAFKTRWYLSDNHGTPVSFLKINYYHFN